MLGIGKKQFPDRFNDPNDLVIAIEEYFDMCEQKGKAWSKAGLCLHLGITKETLKNNGFNPKFAPIIDSAMLMMEEDVEQKMLRGGSTTAGYIFKLKAQFDWSEKQQIDHTFSSANKFLMEDVFEDPYDDPNIIDTEVVEDFGISHSKVISKQEQGLHRYRKGKERRMIKEVDKELKELEELNEE